MREHCPIENICKLYCAPAYGDRVLDDMERSHIARKAREDVLSGLIDLASNYFETLEDGANRGLPLTSDVEAIPPSKLLEWIESLRTAQSEQAGEPK